MKKQGNGKNSRFILLMIYFLTVMVKNPYF